MLVLTRKQGEGIILRDLVGVLGEIKVEWVPDKKRFRVCFDGFPGITIIRSELLAEPGEWARSAPKAEAGLDNPV